ncbi:MAG: hypothetical protein ACI8UO_003585 [Verrucomicrobiales bacterium]|jgi:uncharacterized protein YbbC (DUF1343 family)/CubicO group peptidase (beta-lactamase class C family)
MKLFATLMFSSALVAANAFDEQKLEALDKTIETAIADGRIPGAVLRIEAKGRVHERVYGNRVAEPKAAQMKVDTVFDAASLTKIVATAPSILLLLERGDLKLEQTVTSVIPEFKGHGKEKITIQQLLTHTSGLLSGIPKTELPGEGYETNLKWVYQCKPKTSADSKMIYSDLNFLLLGEIVHRVTGENLDVFAKREIWEPLGMKETTYKPGKSLHSRIAPTEKLDGAFLHGVVHDPTCRRMGGVSGNAGMFTTAADLARFARMILEKGEFGEDDRLFEADAIKLSTGNRIKRGVEGGERGLGWDIDTWLSESPRGKHFAKGKSFGHTGYTGCFVWIDPTHDMFVILMSSRLHPDGGDVRKLRFDVATLAAEASKGLKPKLAPKSAAIVSPPPAFLMAPRLAVLNGIDSLAANDFKALAGLKVGLITNHTGVSRTGETTIDLLHESPNVQLLTLFGPEHGIRGELDQAEIKDGKDDKTGLPIYSLYGDSKKPNAAHLKGLDALVFDIQDIGCRFYTYISTMRLAMEAAAESDLQFIVLDRVNPIGGEVVDGPVRTAKQKFTSPHPIAIQHGMTVGELARMFRAELEIGVDLKVIEVENWKRSMRFDDTGLKWINPSPNMRSLEAAVLYPGIGLLEFTELSVGRGTKTPFEHIGAPYIDSQQLLAALEAEKLAGIRFKAASYTPNASVFEGQKCAGVSFRITDWDSVRPIDTGLTIAKYLARTREGYDIEDFDVLLNHPATLAAVKAQKSNDEIREIWAAEAAEFRERRARFLLY